MKQADLNRAVAQATGETVSYIERLGFNLHVVPVARPRAHRYRRKTHHCGNGRTVQRAA